MSRYLPHVLAGYIVFVFVQSLFFKFSGSEETVIIFTTIADWMSAIPGLHVIAEPFGRWGGYAVGTAELIASILLVFAVTRAYGALLALGVISGAIFFHLATPLGVVRTIDAAGNTDGGVLFLMACGVFASSVALLWLSRGDLSNRLPGLRAASARG